MKGLLIKLWDSLNGNKTTIGAVAMMVLQSKFAENHVEPSALSLLFNMAMVVFGGGIGHKAIKRFKK